MQSLILKIANEYNKQHGYNKIKSNNSDIDKGKAFLIGTEYNNIIDNHKDIETTKAYRQFKKELIAQYRILKKYIRFEFVEVDPYKTSKAMFNDINKNKRLKVFVGGEYHRSLKGINKIFRAVHDIFGHYINYNSFSTNGEYKAFKHHRQMFSELANKALYTESIAQVCYYSINKKYAVQKSGLYNNYFINLV